MMNTKYKTIGDMIIKLQILHGKTKLEFHQDSSNFYDLTNDLRQSGLFHFDEDPFGKNAQATAMIMHKALLIIKFFQVFNGSLKLKLRT